MRFGNDVSLAALVGSLRTDGWAIIEHAVDLPRVDMIRRAVEPLLVAAGKGDHEYLGLETRRTRRILGRTRAIDELVLSPLVEAVLDELIGEHQLNAPSAIELLPGEVEQFWHHDDMFYPMQRPHPPVVLNTFWALVDFTEANGATRLATGSHRWERGRETGPDDAVVVATMPAGSVALWDGALWHSAGANRTGRSRIGLSIEYSASWLRPQENLVLSVPPAIARDLPRRLQELLGYGVTSTGIGHVGGEHPTVVFDDPQAMRR